MGKWSPKRILPPDKKIPLSLHIDKKMRYDPGISPPPYEHRGANQIGRTINCSRFFSRGDRFSWTESSPRANSTRTRVNMNCGVSQLLIGTKGFHNGEYRKRKTCFGMSQRETADRTSAHFFVSKISNSRF